MAKSAPAQGPSHPAAPQSPTATSQLAACTDPRVSLTSEMSHIPKGGGAVAGLESYVPVLPECNKEVHFCILSTDSPP